MSKPSDSYRFAHCRLHLGKTLRAVQVEEHDLFLAWLLERVSEHEVDAVLVAGDADSGMPRKPPFTVTLNLFPNSGRGENANSS